jgi:hypothetical protein
MRGLKKPELVRKADEELSGLRWLPDCLRAAMCRKSSKPLPYSPGRAAGSEVDDLTGILHFMPFDNSNP